MGWVVKLAVALFLIAATVKIASAVLLLKGKIRANPHAAIIAISGVVFAGIGLTLFLWGK